MRSLWWALIQYGRALRKGGGEDLDTEGDMHTREKSHEHEDRNQDDASTSQGMPQIASKSSETRRGMG